MFTPETLSLLVQPIGGNGIRIMGYETDDDLPTVTGTDYFANAKRYGVRPYDLILVTPLIEEADQYIAVIEDVDDDGNATAVVHPNDATKIFGTIASLRANTDASPARASVLGYYSAIEPRGAGDFALDASDTTTADDGGWTIVDAIGGRWKRICDRSVAYADDFGAKGDNSNDDGPAARTALAKMTAVGTGTMRFRGGVYKIGGDGTDGIGDQWANGLLIPGRGSGNTLATLRVTIEGEGQTRLVAGSDNMMMIRVCDAGARVRHIDLYNPGLNATTFTNNIGLFLGPEDVTDTETFNSTNFFVAEDMKIEGFLHMVWSQPGPDASGNYVPQFHNVRGNMNVHSFVGSQSVNNSANYPTRMAIFGGTIERTTLGFDMRVTETWELYGVSTQSVDKNRAYFPNYAPEQFILPDESASVYLTGPGSNGNKVFGGKNESAATTYLVNASVDAPRSGLWFIGCDINALSIWDGVTSAIPHAVIQGHPRYTTYANPVRTDDGIRVRHMYGAGGGGAIAEFGFDYDNTSGVDAPKADFYLAQYSRRRFRLDDPGASPGGSFFFATSNSPGSERDFFELTGGGIVNFIGTLNTRTWAANGATETHTRNSAVVWENTQAAASFIHRVNTHTWQDGSATAIANLTATGFIPATNNTLELGSTSLRFEKVWSVAADFSGAVNIVSGGTFTFNGSVGAISMGITGNIISFSRNSVNVIEATGAAASIYLRTNTLNFRDGSDVGYATSSSSGLLPATANGWAVGSTTLPVGQVTTQQLMLAERSTDPSAPAEGRSIIWHSDGSGAGDPGDVMIKVTEGGVTKTITLVDFSAAP